MYIRNNTMDPISMIDNMIDIATQEYEQVKEELDEAYEKQTTQCKEDYEKTFISMVTETLVDEGTLFISEKIWKPIMVGHPFIVFGNLWTLKFLKSMGYKTFDKWINEEYDNEPDSGKRCNMITDELVKLSIKTEEELKLIRDEMNEVCNHNQKWYKKLYDEKYGGIDINGDLTKIFEEVWNELKK